MKLKKLICITLSFIIAALSCACAKTETVAETDAVSQASVVHTDHEETKDDYITISVDGIDDFSIPDIGGEIDGFTVTGVYDLIETEGKYITFEHEATGLQLAYAATADKNRAFDIGFATRGENNYGTPHVLEHCTICGSEKYPASALFFDANSNCYTTDINASTYPYLTSYYSSSLSELQLTTIFDMYINSTFHPSVLTNDHFLNREGWRYELPSADSDLTINGVIYNEMQGDMGSISSYADYKTAELLYGKTAAAYNTGGDPEELINLTHDELVEYYNKYYSPSNAYIIFYGDLDIFYYLEKLNNEYLAGMEKTERPELSCNYSNPDFGGVKRFTIEMPASADAKTESAAYIIYCINPADITSDDAYVMQSALCSALRSKNSPLSRLMEETFPGKNYSIRYYGEGTGLYFCLENADEDDSEVFYDTINKGLKRILDEGFDETDIKAIQKSIKRSIIFNQGESLGTDFFGGTYDYDWAITGDPCAYIHELEARIDFADNGTGADLQELIKDYLIDPAQAVLTTTVPVPGLLEKNEQEFKDTLADKKASMSKEEIDSMVAATEEYDNIEKAFEESGSPIDEIAILTPDDLDIEYNLIDVSDEDRDGVRYLTADISSDDYVAMDYYLDSSVISQEDLLDYRFLANILGCTDTAEHSYEEINSLIKLYCNNFYTVCDEYTKDSDSYVPEFTIHYAALTEDAEKVENLINEILYMSDFSDYDRLRNLASEELGYYKSDFNDDPCGIAYYVACCQSNPSLLYNYHISYFDFWQRLEEIENMDDDEMAAFAAKLDAMLDKLLNRNDMVCGIYASEKNKDVMTTLAEKFVAGLSDEKETKYTYSFDRLPKNIAIKVSGTSNYNLVWGSKEVLGEIPDSSIYAAMSIVDGDYLYPEMREARGCYGAYTENNGKHGITCYSYRDSDIKGTYEYFNELPDLIREKEFSQDDIDDAIVQSYSILSSPKSDISVASSTMKGLISGGDTAEVILKKMTELKAATPDCMYEYADLLEKVNKDGYHVTAGCATDIDKNADMFDLIIDYLIK